MQKWLRHVAMMRNIISHLILFEIFDSENEYLRFCVHRVLLRFIGFKLESAPIHVAPLFPLETYYLLLNVRSKSQIVPREYTKYPPSTTTLVVV